MTYKPEIDGLRAIAVLLVLFTHMQLGATGGYIGVDVFFVISGYLITSIIVSGIEKDKFGFWNFFGRRFVRLYPALLVMCVVLIIAALLIASPSFVDMVGRSGKYALASIANIYYNQHLGYFDQAAKAQPFLHTWSLGVEWQFYLVWPFIIWAAMKVSRRFLVGVLLFIIIASVVASQWAVIHDTNAAYYLMPYRAFELGAGALMVFFYAKAPKPIMGATLMFSGVLALLVLSFFVYTSATPFPGLAGVPPTLATIACMYGGQSFTRGNFLRYTPVVYIGKISYSLYLYHWPLLLLYAHYVYRDLHLAERIALVFVSIILGAISYELVEKRINWRKMKNKLLGCVVLSVFIAASIGLCQFIYKDERMTTWRIANNELTAVEYNLWGGEHYGQQLRVLGAKDKQPFAVFAGDSTMGNFSMGLDEYLAKQDVSAYNIFTLGCLISETDTRPNMATPLCKSISKQALDLAREKQLPLVISQAWWFSTNVPLLNENNTPKDTPPNAPVGEVDFILANLDHIRTLLPNQPLILVGGIPFVEAYGTPSDCLLRPDIIPSACKKELKDFSIREGLSYSINIELEKYAQTHENVFYIDPATTLCPNGICSISEHARYYVDKIHLSAYGSQKMAPFLYEEIKKVLRKPSTQAALDEPKDP